MFIHADKTICPACIQIEPFTAVQPPQVHSNGALGPHEQVNVRKRHGYIVYLLLKFIILFSLIHIPFIKKFSILEHSPDNLSWSVNYVRSVPLSSISCLADSWKKCFIFVKSVNYFGEKAL